jgi:hypothetical protein
LDSLEGIIAIAAGIAAGSVSLIGFGFNSAIEVSAALIVTWRLRREHRDGCTQTSDRRATRAIAVSFGLLAAYVAIEAVRDLVGGIEPDASLVGVALAVLSLAVMPWLARAKRALGPALGSQAVVADANQTNPRPALRCGPRRPGRQRRAGMVVGRPQRRDRHRGAGHDGSRTHLARRGPRGHLLRMT